MTQIVFYFKGIGGLASQYVEDFFKKKVQKKNLTDENGRYHVSHEVYNSDHSLAEYLRFCVCKVLLFMQTSK